MTIRETAVVFERVFAEDRQGPSGTALGQVKGVTLWLGPGIHAVLGNPEDGTVALAELVAGQRRPRAGRVLVHGREPVSSPRTRGAIGSLPLRPTRMVGGTVGDALALAAHLSARPADDPLEPLGIASLGQRAVSSLSMAELRAVQLALALALPEPRALVLHEPFSQVAHVDLAALRERLRDRASAGTCVLITTSAPGDINEIADHLHLLDRGVLVGSDDTIGWSTDHGRELLIWLADDTGEAARGLAAVLSKSDAVDGVAWLHAEGSSGLSSVAVRAERLEHAALAIAESCAALRSPVTAMVTRLRSVEQLRASAQAYREQAQGGGASVLQTRGPLMAAAAQQSADPSSPAEPADASSPAEPADASSPAEPADASSPAEPAAASPAEPAAAVAEQEPAALGLEEHLADDAVGTEDKPAAPIVPSTPDDPPEVSP